MLYMYDFHFQVLLPVLVYDEKEINMKYVFYTYAIPYSPLSEFPW